MSSNNEKPVFPQFPEDFRSQLTDPALKAYISSFDSDASIGLPNASNKTSYKAEAHLVMGIAGEVRVQVTEEPQRASFVGVCGGLVGGVGKWWGDLYTSDINKVYSDTYSFETSFVNILLASYMHVIFFDGNSKVLGHFQGGGLAGGYAAAGGKGSWTRG